jgi:hypothetical protein
MLPLLLESALPMDAADAIEPRGDAGTSALDESDLSGLPIVRGCFCTMLLSIFCHTTVCFCSRSSVVRPRRRTHTCTASVDISP